jgi:hypothetical protein
LLLAVGSAVVSRLRTRGMVNKNTAVVATFVKLSAVRLTSGYTPEKVNLNTSVVVIFVTCQRLAQLRLVGYTPEVVNKNTPGVATFVKLSAVGSAAVSQLHTRSSE